MKLINDYYRFERLPNQKSKTRLNCTASSASYPEFDEKPFIYIGVNDHIKASRQRKTDLSVTSGKGRHLTSIYKPDMERGRAYGDMQGTTDLILFATSNFGIAADGTISDGAVVEIFICRGKKQEKNAVFNLFTDGELDSEIAQIKAWVTKSVT